MKISRQGTALLLLVGAIMLGGATRHPKPAPDPTPSAPAVQSEKTDDKPFNSVALPAVCTEFHAADGGRKIVFYLKAERKLIVVDVVAGKITGEIAVPADDARFSCTRDRILVALPEQRLIQAYDLATFKRLKTARLPDEHPLKDIRSGCTSKGPVYLHFGGSLEPISPDTLAPLKLEGKMVGGDQWYSYRVSADGSTVTSYQTYSSPADYQVMRVEGGATTIVNGPQAFSMANRTFTPTADGSYILYGLSIYDRNTHDVPADNLKEYSASVPTADPRFFFVLRQTSEKSAVADVAICAANDRQILGVVHGIQGVASAKGWQNDSWGCVAVGQRGGGEPRLLFLPDEQLLAVVPESGNSVEIRHVSLTSIASEKGAAGLAVISMPPTEVKVGRPMTYTIETVPPHAAARCSLESGPEGMKISATGVVTWTPKVRPVGGKENVIISVVDASGREVMHSFSIEVRAVDEAPPAVVHATPRPGAVASGGGDKPRVAPSGPLVLPRAGVPPTVTKITKADGHRIEMPSGNFRYTPGWNNQSTLLLCGNQLAVLAADGSTIRQVVTLSKTYVAIGERQRYYVAVAGSPPTVDILDKATFKPIRSRVLPGREPCDLVLHPTRPICYVAQTGPGKPASKFVIVDETTVEAREDDRWVGQWLSMSPDGSFMMAGYHDIYVEGHDIIDNPDRIWIEPRYGSMDILIRYDLRDDGLPSGFVSKDDAGGNGNGIRMSADGKRVIYLSHVGSPTFSSNLAGWDPSDLSKVPVAYGTKDRASTMEAAFHPVLPLLASPGSGSSEGTVVLFNRESGDVEADRVPSVDLKTKQIDRVFFSPDGRQLIADTVVNGIHYLYHMPLKLNAAETERLKQPATPPKPREIAPLQRSERASLEGLLLTR